MLGAQGVSPSVLGLPVCVWVYDAPCMFLDRTSGGAGPVALG